jgi:predicted ATPase/class 3 adenylate cyclase/DNA-binding CsgD family transcriptional regulator
LSTLPSGTVTLLLADVEGSTRRWETEPEAMAAAVARLDATLAALVPMHGAHRPLDQGEGDSFFLAFARAGDAVECALALQRADLAPIQLRIGLHTGDVERRGDQNYAGPAVNRCARLRDVAAGGQTLLSQTTRDLVVDRMADDRSLVDLGVHLLRDLARPERIFQLHAPDLPSDFPPLRSLDTYTHNLPIQLTTFIGRERELADVSALLRDNRLVTITGSGGCGKTRLAVQVAAEIVARFPGGTHLVDLAPMHEPAMVARTIAEVLRIPDASREVIESVVGKLRDVHGLLIVDNCEHLIDACAEVVDTILRRCPSMTMLATSREPLGVEGETTWRVPSMDVPTDAVALFADRARRARSDFELTDANRADVESICTQLEGIPLAIELAAARIRVLPPDQIAGGLRDRFRVLSGGSRTAVPRQQTLRASIDWSHELLTEPDRILFRRLAAFVGSFDLAAAEAIASGEGLARHHVLDQLTSLIDKSLVIADVDGRHRLLEMVRQYALDKLADAGESDTTWRRHRDHFLEVAGNAYEHMRTPEQTEWILRVHEDLDNMRAASAWSHDIGEHEAAIRLALPFFYLPHGWGLEADWLTAALAADDVPVALRIQGCAAQLRGLWWYNLPDRTLADRLIDLGRASGDPALLAFSLDAACQASAWSQPEVHLDDVREAVSVAEDLGDPFLLSDVLCHEGDVVALTGRPLAARPMLERSAQLALVAGHRYRAHSAWGRTALVSFMVGDLRGCRELAERVAQAAETRHRILYHQNAQGTVWSAFAAALCGEDQAATLIRVAEDVVPSAPYTRWMQAQLCWLRGVHSLVTGSPAAARASFDDAMAFDVSRALNDLFVDRAVEVDLALGDPAGARSRGEALLRRWDDLDRPWHRAAILVVLARIALAERDVERAEEVAQRALAATSEVGDRLRATDAIELLARVALDNDAFEFAARLLAAADAGRASIGAQRFAIYAEAHDAAVAELGGALGDAFDGVWAEGAALTLDEAIAYARRGWGERKRPTSGWHSLTPTELDVVRLVADGLANKEIAARLFISPRTVQAHLTHVYSKLGVSSRVALAKEAAIRSAPSA